MKACSTVGMIDSGKPNTLRKHLSLFHFAHHNPKLLQLSTSHETSISQSSTLKCKVDVAYLPAIRVFFCLVVAANKSVFLGLVIMTREIW